MLEFHGTILKNEVWTRELTQWIMSLLCKQEHLSWDPHTCFKAEDGGSHL